MFVSGKTRLAEVQKGHDHIFLKLGVRSDWELFTSHLKFMLAENKVTDIPKYIDC